MTHSEVEQVRHTRGRSMLLFITDRCPVGCQHCSVDSRADSPTISDFDLFGEIVKWLCGKPEIEVIGISGGEPFVERDGLSFASRQFADAEKRQVVFTSGVWATAATTPRWIRDVLARCSCVYLSTDAFHAQTVTHDRFLRAVNAIVAADTWIVVQVLDHEQTLHQTERLLRDAFGDNWTDYAELNTIVPLTNGRGANVFTRTAQVPGHAFGPCALVASPMVRYDGLVTGCCNESVIMNLGPSRLRKRARSIKELAAAVEAFHADPLLQVIGGAGLGVLTEHPRFIDFGEEQFTSNCELCWKILYRLPQESGPDRLVTAISALKITE
jgi:MoaA/NifB/PqqE/SkfB family radical SAM enzyme